MTIGSSSLTAVSRLAVSLMGLVLGGVPVIAGQEPTVVKARQPLPPEIIQAWRKGGAHVVWMEDPVWGFPVFQGNQEPGSLPGFRFGVYKQGILANLPAPGMAFGLILPHVADADMKLLAALKGLQILDIENSA